MPQGNSRPQQSVKSTISEQEGTNFLVQLNIFVEPKYAVLLILVLLLLAHKSAPKSQANANKHR